LQETWAAVAALAATPGRTGSAPVRSRESKRSTKQNRASNSQRAQTRDHFFILLDDVAHRAMPHNAVRILTDNEVI